MHPDAPTNRYFVYKIFTGLEDTSTTFFSSVLVTAGIPTARLTVCWA